MSGPAVRFAAFLLPLTEVFSLLVVGLVLVAGLATIAVSRAAERRTAKRRLRESQPPGCESPSVI